MKEILRKISSLEEKMKIHEIDKTRLENLVCSLNIKNFELLSKVEKNEKKIGQMLENPEKNYVSENKENFQDENILKKKRMSLAPPQVNSEFEKNVFKRRSSLENISQIKQLIHKEMNTEQQKTKISNLEKRLNKSFQKINFIEKISKEILQRTKEKVSVSEVQSALNELQKKLKQYVEDNNENIRTNLVYLQENLNGKIKQSSFKIKQEMTKTQQESAQNSSKLYSSAAYHLENRRSSRLSKSFVHKYMTQNPSGMLNDIVNEVYSLKEENNFLKTLINTKFTRKDFKAFEHRMNKTLKIIANSIDQKAEKEEFLRLHQTKSGKETKLIYEDDQKVEGITEALTIEIKKKLDKFTFKTTIEEIEQKVADCTETISKLPPSCSFKLRREDLLADKSYALNTLIYNMNPKLFSWNENTNFVKVRNAGFYSISLGLDGNSEQNCDYFKVKIGENEVKMTDWNVVSSSGVFKRRISNRCFWVDKEEEVFLRYFGDRRSLHEIYLKISKIF